MFASAKLDQTLRLRYGQNKALAFTASICFEQMYGKVDGDSASSAEAYAILSRFGMLY